MSSFKGYKTYAVCAIAIVYALSAFATGHIDGNTMMQTIMAALGGASMRHAL